MELDERELENIAKNLQTDVINDMLKEIDNALDYLAMKITSLEPTKKTDEAEIEAAAVKV